MSGVKAGTHSRRVSTRLTRLEAPTVALGFAPARPAPPDCAARRRGEAGTSGTFLMLESFSSQPSSPPPGAASCFPPSPPQRLDRVPLPSLLCRLSFAPALGMGVPEAWERGSR